MGLVRKTLRSILFGSMALILPGLAGANAEPCLGFTPSEAAALLGVSSAQLKHERKELHRGLWQCSFAAGTPALILAYSVERAADEKTARRDLERYRENLETAAQTAPFRNKLPKGAWSEISDIGDENVWTDINATMTFRRKAVTVQVQSPADKLLKIKAAQALARKLP